MSFKVLAYVPLGDEQPTDDLRHWLAAKGWHHQTFDDWEAAIAHVRKAIDLLTEAGKSGRAVSIEWNGPKATAALSMDAPGERSQS